MVPNMKFNHIVNDGRREHIKLLFDQMAQKSSLQVLYQKIGILFNP
jgi:hypothetical protein